MQNETISRQNRVLSPIILAVSIVILLFVFRPIYLGYVEDSEKQRSLKSTVEEKNAQHESLELIRSQLNSGTTTALAQRVEQIQKKFIVSDIMESVLINEYTKSTVDTKSRIEVSTISVDKGSKLPSGLSMGKVNVNIKGGNVYDVIDFITYLTTASPYAFTIDNISLPLDTDLSQSISTNNNTFALSLSLGLYYYE